MATPEQTPSKYYVVLMTTKFSSLDGACLRGPIDHEAGMAGARAGVSCPRARVGAVARSWKRSLALRMPWMSCAAAVCWPTAWTEF